MHPFNNHQLICYQKDPQQLTWKICIPTAMLDELIYWYHNVLLHIGSDYLSSSIATHFFHPDLDSRVKTFVSTCSDCQTYKCPGHGYGQLAPREALFQPFTEIAVDMIGPWKVCINNELLIFHALMIIDTVSNLVEIAALNCASGDETACTLEHIWLYRYPQPNTCIHDQGPEFNNHVFQFKLTEWGIKLHPISVKNLQANSICE